MLFLIYILFKWDRRMKKHIYSSAPIVAGLRNKLTSEKSDIHKNVIYISNTVLLLKIDFNLT